MRSAEMAEEASGAQTESGAGAVGMPELCDLYTANMTEAEAGNYSPLVLAFIGDAAYELAVRTMIVKKGNGRPNDLNRRKAKLVKAEAQSAMVEVIKPILTDPERAVYKRGRNAKSFTVAKNATVHDYRRATGFEALLGYLYLCGKYERLFEIIRTGLENYGQN